jgi:hypothetical protein
VFLIYSGDTLIGRSALEGGDPPMGVASGKFVPTDAYTSFRSQMLCAKDGGGKSRSDIRILSSLSAETADGVLVVCSGGVEVLEYIDQDETFGIEVFCLGIGYPTYAELFPHHVKAYDDQFKAPKN